MSKEDKIEKTKENIEFWENELKEALNKGDTMRAVGCRLLSNDLRRSIGEEVK